MRAIETEIERLDRRRPKDAKGRQEHTKAVCALKAHPTQEGFVRETAEGRLRLVRVTEVRCGVSWRQVRWEMDHLHRGMSAGSTGRFAQLTRLSNAQRHYLKRMRVAEPKPFEEFAVEAGGVEAQAT